MDYLPLVCQYWSNDHGWVRTLIRVRALPKRWLRRRRFEVEYRPEATDEGWRRSTPCPVFDLEQVVGTGEAWAMIHAAGAAPAASTSDWVTIPLDIKPG